MSIKSKWPGVVLLVGVGASAAALAATPQRSPLTDLLDRAGRYVVGYEEAYAIVAEETYIQEVKAPPALKKAGPRNAVPIWSEDGRTQKTHPDWGKDLRREMRSDFLLVQLADGTRSGFRDVIEVDGRPVRDREGKLAELFLKAQAGYKTILDESTKYNIGTVTRNFNVPTYALHYLHPAMQEHFVFGEDGRDEVEGTPCSVITFQESSAPTIVRDHNGRDIPSHGRFCIAATGTVLRTELIVGVPTSAVVNETTVSYRNDASLGFPVPVQMKEIYRYPSKPLDPIIECTASYGKFRRFSVTTDAEPKED